MQSTPPCIPELYHIYYNCCYSPMAHLHLVRTTEALLRAAPPCRRAAQPQACQPLQALAYSCSHPPATASHPQSHMHVLHPLPQPWGLVHCCLGCSRPGSLTRSLARGAAAAGLLTTPANLPTPPGANCDMQSTPHYIPELYHIYCNCCYSPQGPAYSPGPGLPLPSPWLPGPSAGAYKTYFT